MSIKNIDLDAESPLRKILIIFPGALGDFICFLPALEKLARNRRVDVLARAEYADLAPPGVHVDSLERREIGALFREDPAAEPSLGAFFQAYERVYSWLGSSDRNFVENLRHAVAGHAAVFPFRPAEAASHITDYYLDCVGGKYRAKTFPRVAVANESRTWARRWLDARGWGGRKILALALGSGALEKNWPAEFFRTVERWWTRERGGITLAILGPAEEKEFGDWRGAGAVRGLGLGQLAAVLSLADLYIGNDSGPTHLAAAVGAETVALFGPTDTRQWAPRGERVTILTQSVECSPCDRETMKRCPHRKCLNTLEPHRVIDVVERLLARKIRDFPVLDKGVGRH